MDITYIPMARGFVYLAAVSTGSAAGFCPGGCRSRWSGVLRRGAGGGFGQTRQARDFQHRPGQPVHQRRLHRRAARNAIAISMDGKGAWRDNVFVERLWRIGQIRGGLSASLRQRRRGARLDRPVSGLLQSASVRIRALTAKRRMRPTSIVYHEEPAGPLGTAYSDTDVGDNGVVPETVRQFALGGGFSRREFVGATGAVLALGSVGACPDGPHVDVVPGGFKVSYKNFHPWIVTHDMFLPAGLLPVEVCVREVSPANANCSTGYNLSLSHATYCGSDLSPDFEATIAQDSSDGSWFIRICFSEIGRALKLALDEWLPSRGENAIACAGRARRQYLRAGRNGGSGMRFKQATIGFRADFSGNIKAGVDEIVYQVGEAGNRGFVARCSEVDFEQVGPQGAAEPSSTPTPLEQSTLGSAPFTRFTLIAPEIKDGLVALGQIEPSMQVSCDLSSPAVTVEAFGSGSGIFSNADAYIKISSDDGGALVVLSNGAGAEGARVQLTAPLVEFTEGNLPQRILVEGSIAKRIHGVESRAFAVMIEGEGEKIDRTFGDRPLKSLSIMARLRSVHVPIDQGATADATLTSSTTCELLFQGCLDEPRSRVPSGGNVLVWIGQNDTALEMPLEDTRVRISRCRDLFNLTFGFRNYALSYGKKGTVIRPRRTVVVDPDGTPELPLIVVQFPPQYVFEEAFQPSVNSPVEDPDLGDGRVPLANACRARTKIANKSRLVFRDSSIREDEWEFDKALTIEYLTEWRELSMAVNQRAAPRNTTLQKQLESLHPKIVPGTLRSEALTAVFDQMKPPSEQETAIEPIYRMILSPDSNAKWTVPAPLLDDGCTAEVWAARLANPNETAVRAIWARGMNPCRSSTQITISAPTCDPAFAGSLIDDDRAQIVALSSFYGLAALRREKKTPEGLIIDDPLGMVFRPSQNYAYLKTDEEGIITPKPFDTFSLILSRASTVSAHWKGEPPAPLDGDPFFSEAFTVERYLHRVQDGRDAFVEVSYKGFLLPFGHRVAWLKVTQREFHAYTDTTDGLNPTAYLVQHMYVVCRNPVKAFPAYNQPFGANDCQPRSVELLTTLTPDLIDPTEFPQVPTPLQIPGATGNLMRLPSRRRIVSHRLRRTLARHRLANSALLGRPC
jgi:hypothetical protein